MALRPAPSGAPQSQPVTPVRVFVSYSHRDEDLREQLERHLAVLKSRGLIEVWHDRKIDPGQEWEPEIRLSLENADLILLLISSDFVSSDSCYREEMDRALELHAQGRARVIPVLLRPGDYKGAPFMALEWLPKNGKPVTQWRKTDAALKSVVKGIREVVEKRQSGDPPRPELGRDTHRTRRGLASLLVAALFGFSALLFHQMPGSLTSVFGVFDSRTGMDETASRLSATAGAALALIGEPSGEHGGSAMVKALLELGLPPESVEDYSRRYSELHRESLSGARTSDEARIGRAALISSFQRQFTDSGTGNLVALNFGYDLVSLKLQLTSWRNPPSPEEEEDAEKRLNALKFEATAVPLPEKLFRMFQRTRLEDLRNPGSRESVTELLDDASQALRLHEELSGAAF